MSQENVELVRHLYGEGPLGLVVSLDDERALLDRLFRDYYDEQLEIRMPGDYPEGEQVFRGREGIAQLLAMLRDTWEEFRLEPERFMDAGDQVVVLVRVVAAGGASGATTERKRPISGLFVTVACRPFTCTGIARRPSKPWGCGSR
jgi:ketosteroid isomerase-like protein